MRRPNTRFILPGSHYSTPQLPHVFHLFIREEFQVGLVCIVPLRFKCPWNPRLLEVTDQSEKKSCVFPGGNNLPLMPEGRGGPRGWIMRRTWRGDGCFGGSLLFYVYLHLAIPLAYCTSASGKIIWLSHVSSGRLALNFLSVDDKRNSNIGDFFHFLICIVIHIIYYCLLTKVQYIHSSLIYILFFYSNIADNKSKC